MYLPNHGAHVEFEENHGDLLVMTLKQFGYTAKN